MKKSDIYEIAIKVLGLYLLIDLIRLIAPFISLISLLTGGEDSGDFNDQVILSLSVHMVNIIAVVCLVFLFVFRTNQVTRRICSASDFESEARLFGNAATIYEISLRISGLIVILWTLPQFAIRLISHITYIQSHPGDSGNETVLTEYALKLVLATIFILGAKGMASFFAGKHAIATE